LYVIKKEHVLSDIEFFSRICVDISIDKLSSILPKNITITILDAKITTQLDSYGGATHTGHIDNFKESISKCHIKIYDDLEIYLQRMNKKYGKYDKTRYNTFLESLEIPVNKFPLFLLILLHEFGHAYIMKIFTDIKLQREYITFDILSEAMSDIFLTNDILNKADEYELDQFVNGLEAQCDIFAMNNFLPLWKKVEKYTNSGFKI
jgi:hypothetical protein